MRSLLTILLALVCAVSSAQTNSYSCVTSASGNSASNGVTITETANIQYSSKCITTGDCQADLYFPASRSATAAGAVNVVDVHGGGWTGTADKRCNWYSTSANPAGPAAIVAQTGVNYWELNYTLSVGTTATQNPNQQQNVDCALRYIAANYGGPIILVGQSAGAHLALQDVMNPPTLNCEVSNSYSVAALVLISPIVDLPAAYASSALAQITTVQGYIRGYVPCTAPCTDAATQAVSPINSLATGKVPRTLLLGGVTDTWLDYAVQYNALQTAWNTLSPKPQLTYILYPSLGHLLDCQNGVGSKCVNELVTFIRNVSRSRSSASTFKF